MFRDLVSLSTLMSTSPSVSPSATSLTNKTKVGYRLRLLPTTSLITSELLVSDGKKTSSPAIVPLVSSCASPLAPSFDTSKMKFSASGFHASTSSNATHLKGQTGMNGGRWTGQEHQSFLAGLRLYGREWKKVAAKIKTRTSAQIRSHAQKYFAKLTRDEEMHKLRGPSTVISGPVGYFSDCGSSVAQNNGDDDGDGSDTPRQKSSTHSARQKRETAAIPTAPIDSAVCKLYKQAAGIAKKRSRTAVAGPMDRTGISSASLRYPFKQQKRTNEVSQLCYLPSQEELLAIASPNLRRRLSSLIESELCALQVLSCYAISQQHNRIRAPCQIILRQATP